MTASDSRHAIRRGPDDLDQLVFGDGVADFAAEDVIEARQGAALVAQAQEIVAWDR